MFKNKIENHRDVFIINADDFGYNASIDKGIIELFINQHIKSVSVIVNGENINQVAQFIRQFQEQNIQQYLNCSIGLHLNMTQGKPFSQAMNGTIITENGFYRGKTLFYEIINDEKMEIDKIIEDEARLQIDQFIKLFKRRPSHIDGHNHIHLIPKISKIIAGVMSQTGIYRVRTLDQQLIQIKIQMNHMFKAYNSVSTKIYQNYHIVHPKGFVGLQSFGRLQPSQIEISFKRQEQNSLELHSVELMCHPGYPDQFGVPWVANSDRLIQKKSLESNSFIQYIKKRKLLSYLDLQSRDDIFTPKLLIYSKLNKGTGNYTTTLRLKKMFQKMGFKVYLWNASDLLDMVVEASDLSKFLINFGISIIVGVNVSRSARIIYEATIPIAVPFIFVIAGTDANITFKKPELIKNLVNPLKFSQCLISLSRDMTSITQETLMNLGINKKVHTIVQSTCLGEFLENNAEWTKPQKPYIILPTSFRKVKCVHHLLCELNQLIDNYNIQVYIAGPILDEKYYAECKDQLGKVKYLGVLSKQIYARYLKQAFVMINTSESEGMSCSILQAFQFKVPVIARANSGNLELIKNQYNGLVYHKPNEFIDLFLKLRENQQLRTQISLNGYLLFKEKYSCKTQFEEYKHVIEEIYFSKLFSFQKEGHWVKILNQQSIHPASIVNSHIFQQIQPVLKPQDKIIDIGCGTGIFSLICLTKTQCKDINIYLTDIEFKITANSVYNFRQSSIWSKLSSITYIQSDLFDKIDGTIKYDIVLFNPPQTPFRRRESRPDKNGGPNAIKFYQPILSYISKSNPTRLYLLHSYMAWPSKLKALLKDNKLHVVWKSKQLIHKIHRQAYRAMEPELDEYILEHIREGRAEVVLKQDQFFVPAVLYCIQPQ